MSPVVIRGWLRPALAGIAAYLLALAATLPAANTLALLLPRLQQHGLSVGAAGVDGSVWHGRADAVSINGLALGAARWRLSPLPLLIGHLSLQLALQPPDGELQGAVTIAGGGKVDLAAVTGRVDAATVQHALPYLPLVPTGELRLDLHNLHLSRGLPTRAEGTVVWHGAGTNTPEKLVFGDLKLTLEPSADGIVGHLADGGGPLKADGELRIDPTARSYRLNLTLAPGPGASPALRQAISLLGRPDRNGRVAATFSGPLPAASD